MNITTKVYLVSQNKIRRLSENKLNILLFPIVAVWKILSFKQSFQKIKNKPLLLENDSHWTLIYFFTIEIMNVFLKFR